MAKYLGWIPSIIGNLSYSLAGHSKYPERPKLCIFEYNNSFHYIISQTRISHDFQLGLASLIPFKQWSKKFEAFILEKKGLYSTWVPIMIGTCSCEHHGSIQNSTIGKDYQILKGKVFFIPKIPATKKLLKIFGESIVDMDSYLSNKKSNFNPEKAFEAKQTLESALEQIIQNVKFSLFTCNFELQRNGICTLSNLNIISYETNIASMFDYGESLNEGQACNQVFYFLKDIFHSHKFHSPDYDTLTQVYKFDENNQIGWAIETLKNFYRSAIRFSPEDSLGIVYYARAFKDIINNTGENDDDGFSFLDKKSISDKHAEDVCKARIDRKKKVMDARKWISGLFAGGLLITWSRAYQDIFVFLNISDTASKLAMHVLVPFFIAWFVLIYVEIEKFSLSKFPQVIKLIKYLSSIPSLLQLFTLFFILFVGILLICISYYI